jgi:hypothetical protein
MAATGMLARFDLPRHWGRARWMGTDHRSPILGKMTELAEYRDSGAVEVLTFAQAAERFSQGGQVLPVAI